jgi:hypothetical protein
MAKAPFYQATKDRWIVKDLFAKNYVSTGDDLFSITEVSANGRDGLFNSKEEALEAIAERKLETGRGLSSKEINRKYRKFIKAEGFNKWEETDKATKSRIKQAYANEKNPRETTSFFKKEGLSKRINVKTRELLEKKKPINPRTGLPYTLAEYTDLTSGQKQKLLLRMKGLKRKDVKYKPRQGYYPEKDANRLINYMKLAAEKQEKAGIPLEERTYTNVFDKNKKFVGVNDVRQNKLFTHIDYDLGKAGAQIGTVITQHPDYEDMQGFFKVAKKFKYESPDKLLGSYFAKYERVPTYNEIFTFFTTDRDAPVKIFKNNSLTLQHQELMMKQPTGPFQLLTQIKNTQAATIMNRLNRGEISSQLADYELKKIGAAQEGLGVAAETITPGKGLGVAKRETVKLFKDAVKVNPNIPDDMAARLNINFIETARADAKANGPICKLVRTKRANGGNISCVDAVEEAIQENPKKLAQDVNRLPYEEGPFNKVKSAATGFLNIAKKGGKFGALAAVGAAGAGAVKTFMNDDPTTYLSNENQQKNMLIDMVTGSLDDTPVEEAPIGDAYLPTLGAVTVAGTAATAPSTIEAARSRRFGKTPSGITKTALKTVGRGLTAAATPLGLLATEPLYLAEQVQEGASLGEMATDPFNYLGPAFMGQASDFATKGLKSPGIASAMRLGISPSTLKTVSRRFGLPGLALSLGISGYETFDDYRNKRGFFSEE